MEPKVCIMELKFAFLIKKSEIIFTTEVYANIGKSEKASDILFLHII